MIRSALIYARELGVPVFPVARSKAPLTRHGFRDATTDEVQIERWWCAHPDANVGGACTWFFVVDVDPRSGGDRVVEGWRRVRGEFPRTWLARTGSNGVHYFFQHDEALDDVPLGKLYRGIDIKGAGRHYVLLAPSRNRIGAYRWLVSPKQAELAPAPRWLIDEILRAKQPRSTSAIRPDFSRFVGVARVERARRYAQRVPGAVSGSGGHNATFRLAVILVRGFALSESEAVAVLAEWNATCEPPWSARDLKRKVDEALRVGDMEFGAMLSKGRAA